MQFICICSILNKKYMASNKIKDFESIIKNTGLKATKGRVAVLELLYKEAHPMTVDEIFNSQGIDKYGLDIYDRMYLSILSKHKGTPLGLKSISAMSGIAIETIENSIEPFLIRKGFVVRTQKGRVIGSYDGV